MYVRLKPRRLSQGREDGGGGAAQTRRHLHRPRQGGRARHAQHLRRGVRLWREEDRGRVAGQGKGTMC